MIRTANSEIYQELVQNEKYFRRQIELFVSALAIGIVNDKKSDKKPNHDIIRLSILESSAMKMYRDIIDIITRILCVEKDPKECGNILLSYADGGLELIWKEYQTQGILDLPRFYEETKNKWPKIIKNIFKDINKMENRKY